MATTAVTKTLSEGIKKDISALLGRGRFAFPCPLSDEEQIQLWDNMLPAEIVQSYYTLKKARLDMSSMTSTVARIQTTLGEQKYQIQFIHPTRSFMGKINGVYVERPSTAMNVAMPVAGKWEEFTQWMENCAIIERDFVPALESLAQVLDFCGTIGQLVRAVPDLHKYLPRDKQELLQGQSRASNMPHAWHVYARSRIETLQFAMAKASLLRSHTKMQFEEINVTGAKYVV